MNTAARNRLEDALRRPQRYWNADGIPEIGIGAFWLLWSALVLLPIVAPALARARNLISILGILVAPLLLDFGVKKWKERVTYPRTGYVRLRPPSGKFRLTLVVTAAALAAAVVLFIRFGGLKIRDYMPAVLGGVITLALLQMAWRMRSARLALLSSMVAAVGIGLTFSGVSHDSSTILVFLAAGCVCVLDGGLRMRSYVRAHPIATGELP